MEDQEVLEVFSANGVARGRATRQDVHRQGLWHQTFQIWLVEVDAGVPWVWFQRRSPQKAQYANLWDITVAGHLLAGEEPDQGFREVREELGINIDPVGASYFGVVPDEIVLAPGADRELCHVYFAPAPCDLSELEWAPSEVADVGRVPLDQAASLVRGLRNSMTITTPHAAHAVTAEMLVPHSDDYYRTVFTGLVQHFGSR